MTERNIKEPNNIKVYIRVRPLSEMELQLDASRSVDCIDQRQIRVTNFEGTGSTPYLNFSFDHIFPETAKQTEIYERVAKDIINSTFQGINGTIFCYGQTASGKTYTCVGNDLQQPEQYGLLPRILRQVIENIRNTPSNIDSRAKISIVEIYNERVTDLLDLNHRNLKLRQNKNKGVFIEHVTEKYISSEQQGFRLLELGFENRSVGCTQMNAVSSRSHMLFMITIIQNDFASGEAKTAKMTIIDLAGSQKISKTGTEGKLLSQAIKINTSLSALGNVIHALSENKGGHIPYRDSKLTRLLQESLGGNSMTSLIVNVSPSTFNESQTVTSLRFGHRAKAIKNSPKINKQYTVEQLLILLEKAELKIKAQNKIIEELGKKKRVGGYGVIQEKPLTLHILKDEEDENDSNFDTSSIKDNQSIQSDLKSPRIGKSQKTSIDNIDIDDSSKKPIKPKSKKTGIKSFKKFQINAEENNENLYKLASSLRCLPEDDQPKEKKGKFLKKLKSVKIIADNNREESIPSEQNLLEDVEERVMSRSRSQAEFFSDRQHQIIEQNKQLKHSLDNLTIEMASLRQTYMTVLTEIDELKNQNKLKEQIITKKNVMIEKLKLKNQQRKLQIEKQINNLKRFWEKYYETDEQQRKKSFSKQRERMIKDSDSTATLRNTRVTQRPKITKSSTVELSK